MDIFSIGFNILGYGVLGLIFSLLIGKVVDCWGWCWLIFFGLVMVAIVGLIMVFFIFFFVVIMVILVMFLGYDLI